jgi:hypothetical protein
MDNKHLIDLAESLLKTINEEAENITALQRVSAMPGSQDGVFAALREGIELLSDSHAFCTRLAYEARKAAYENDKSTVTFCVDAITDNINRSEIVRNKMLKLIESTGVING